MGSTTPPWRSLDAPPLTGSEDGQQPRPTNAPEPVANGVIGSASARIVATLAAAAGCAALAVIIATTGGSAADVVVDGGVALPGATGDANADPAVAVGADLVVEVVGAVMRPGVYKLPAGSRTGDLIAAAGGFSPRVDTGRTERELNQAAPLHDGDQVRIPSRDDPSGPPPDLIGGPSGQPVAVGPIDLNRATAAELDTLPGIGPVTADKILAAREEAPFTTVDELRSRGVLGEKTFERVRDLVTVR